MKRESRKFLYLGIIFLAIWTFHMLIVSPFITNNFSENTANIIKTVLKFIIWCGYGWYFVNAYNKDLWLRKEKLFKLPNKSLLFKLIFMIVITAFLAMLNTHKGFNINDFTINDFLPKLKPSTKITEFISISKIFNCDNIFSSFKSILTIL